MKNKIETAASAKAPKTTNLYLVEFYTRSGDINFAWVHAKDSHVARTILSMKQGSRFDCVIQLTQQAAIVPLAGPFRVNTPDANLFIY